MGDFYAHQTRLIALLCGFAALTARRSGPGTALRGLPDTGAAYWAAMLTAGVFGTVVGDIAEHTIGEGPAVLLLTAVLIAALFLGRRSAARVVVIYWATIAVARTTGTAIGDWLADNKALHVGLSLWQQRPSRLGSAFAKEST